MFLNMKLSVPLMVYKEGVVGKGKAENRKTQKNNQ